MGSAAIRSSPLRARSGLTAPGAVGVVVAGWLLGFAPLAYLALETGGFDPLVRGQVALAIWWIVLVAALVGGAGTRWGRREWAVTGTLAAFALWTALSATWSESAEHSVDQASHVLLVAGALALALMSARRVAARHVLQGVGAAVGLVTWLAVLSRLQPSWFPVDDLTRFLADDPNRLSYPLGYWNALAIFIAAGVPVLLWQALAARTAVAGGLAAATASLAVLAVFFTDSRGGVAALALALGAWLVLSPDRLSRLLTLGSTVLGAAVLLKAAAARDDLTEGIATPTAANQGDELLVIAIAVAVGVGLLQAAVRLVDLHLERPGWTFAIRRQRPKWIATLVAIGLLGGLAGGFGAVSDGWTEFKRSPEVSESSARGDVVGRLGSGAGNGRYQYWQAAVEAGREHPLRGLGAGTYDLWWSRAPKTDEIVHHAHSLYLQTFAETGLIGALLIAGFVVLLVGIGLRRRRSTDLAHGAVMAAALAGVVTFALAAGFEWVWDVPAVAVLFALLGAVVVAGRERSGWSLGPPVRLSERATAPAPSGLRSRVALAALAVVALCIVTIPLAATRDIRSSQQAASAGRLDDALDFATGAASLQPYAATPKLQRALILERRGDLPGAIVAIKAAIDREPTNWRLWVTRSRIEATAGDAAAALTSFRRARTLNPASDLFASA